MWCGCTADGAGSEKETCSSNGLVTTYYSDKDCTNVSTSKNATTYPLSCQHLQDSQWRTYTCDSVPTYYEYKSFNATGCADASLTGGPHQVALRDGTCMPEGSNETSGWQHKSRMMVVKNNELVATKYLTKDCSGNANTTTYKCGGVCTASPDDNTSWYTLTSCGGSADVDGVPRTASAPWAALAAAAAAWSAATAAALAAAVAGP